MITKLFSLMLIVEITFAVVSVTVNENSPPGIDCVNIDGAGISYDIAPAVLTTERTMHFVSDYNYSKRESNKTVAIFESIHIDAVGVQEKVTAFDANLSEPISFTSSFRNLHLEPV